MMEVVMTTGAYKTYKAPVKLSPLTNQHPRFTGLMPLLSPKQQCRSSEGMNIHGLDRLSTAHLHAVVLL